jgi:hypothetical protein
MSLAVNTLIFGLIHGGPVDHAAAYKGCLEERNYHVEIVAGDQAFDKLKKKNIKVERAFSIKDLNDEQKQDLAKQIALTNQKALVLITDVGDLFGVDLQRAFHFYAPKVKRAVLYENLEPLVPGSYGLTAKRVIEKTHAIFFANADLLEEGININEEEKIDLAGKHQVGVGYYPLESGIEMEIKRKEKHDECKQAFFEANNILDKGKKVIGYFGGNNEVYFNQALPAFLRQIEEAAAKNDLSNWIILFHQHPGAVARNIDRSQVETWLALPVNQNSKNLPQFIFSRDSVNGDGDMVQIIIDRGIYYQTSMAPLIARAGIPLIQSAHETYPDRLVKNGLIHSVTTGDELFKSLETAEPIPSELIQKCLGSRPDWQSRLEKGLQDLAELKL